MKEVAIKLHTKAVITSSHDCVQLLQVLKDNGVILDYKYHTAEKYDSFEHIMYLSVEVKEE